MSRQTIKPKAESQRQQRMVEILIDGKPYEVAEGMTILEAARQNDIYIPTLCWHEELTPHGGCRMCIVEVEGLRNLPTACTTPCSDGMKIRTHTAQVQDARREILQLFMSEHPSSCLICDEKDQCSVTLNTIRKAGVTTGCRYCSKDQWCELQAIAKYLGVDQLEYPIHYRGLPVEKEDPFYDRDYNLCILCGRCVRVCQEVRLANVLAFKHRGREAVVGPAFDRSHFDAGCEFCGACVEACPVGALKEKVRAWEGEQEHEVTTTCSYCGVGCQVRLLLGHNRVIGSLPAHDDLVNNGQLCVKGRFCITEMVTGHRRLRQPYHEVDGTTAEISWDEALDMAAAKLNDCPPDKFGMLVSANSLNEDMYVAQKFVRLAMKSNQIDCSARLYYGEGFNAYLRLLSRATTLQHTEKASAILCVGLDARFGRSVVGVALRRAMRRGAKVVTVNPRHHALTLTAEQWLHPDPGKEADLLKTLLTRVKSKGKSQDDDLGRAADILTTGASPVVLLGSEFLQMDESADVLAAVEKLADTLNAGVLALPAQNNLFGSLTMGVYPELLPGPVGKSDTKASAKIARLWKADPPKQTAQWNAADLLDGKKLKVLYVVGDVPPKDIPKADYIIFQNIYPPDDALNADLVLPSATFTEANGTFINGEGRLQRVRKGVEPPGRALSDWKVFVRLAEKMGVKGLNYDSVEQVHAEIGRLVRQFGDFEEPGRQPTPLDIPATMNTTARKKPRLTREDRSLPYLLIATAPEHTHRGYPLSELVEGCRQIMATGVLEMNPDDARKARVTNGDEVTVSSSVVKRTFPVRVHSDQPVGTLHVTLTSGEMILPNPHPVKLRKKTRKVPKDQKGGRRHV